jgi:integrase
MARLLVQWSLIALANKPADTKPDNLKNFRLAFNHSYPLLNANEDDTDLESETADWFEGVYGEIIDDNDNSNKRAISSFLYQFHNYLTKTQGFAKIESGDVFEAKNARHRVHADIITIDEFSEFKSFLLNKGNHVGNDVFLRMSKRDSNLPTVVALIALLGYRCGLRRREALHLRLGDVHDLYKVLLIRPHRTRGLKTLSSKRRLSTDLSN